MPHIELEPHLPGITGLLEYRKDVGEPLREMTQILLRGPNSLTEAEREIIATAVSDKNGCRYCATSHAAAASAYLGTKTVEDIRREPQAAVLLSQKMKALLTIALQVQESGKSVTPESVAKARAEGASDREIHDTVMIAALFCFYNRYVDGLGTVAPSDPHYYEALALRLKETGYGRPTAGYEHMKKQTWK